MWYVFSFLVRTKQNSITNLKFQHKPKYHLFKILISKQTYYYLGAKIPQAIVLYNGSKHNILAYQGNSNKEMEKGMVIEFFFKFLGYNMIWFVC